MTVKVIERSVLILVTKIGHKLGSRENLRSWEFHD